MQKSGKLELTWVGKYEQKEIEPRILVENPELGYGDQDTGNMLIHGDNLIALKALEQDYAGKIKCIYIDPPYNTGSAFKHYDDGVEHSVWLSLMQKRIDLLYALLSEDGSLWISIDDDERDYLKILCDEIFGRQNFVCSVIWHKKGTRSNDARWFSDNHDYILVYAKDKQNWKPNLLPRPDDSMDGYSNPDNDSRGVWASGPCHAKTPNEKDIYEVTTPSGRKIMPPPGTSWRFSEEKFNQLIKDNRIWFGEKGSNVPRYKRFLTEVQNGFVPTTLWFRDEVGDNQEAKKEVKGIDANDVFSTPKPERLLQRIVLLATREGDIVLDSFLGSGTTAAVAHKMGRRWIGIELGNHAYTHCKVRMDRVIDGEQGGISKAVNWKGGGGYKFYELAPSLLVPNPKLPTIKQINPEYTFEMMCEAICKLEGFKYKPDGKFQGKSSEQRFIHITKEFVNGEYVNSLLANLGEGQSLLVYGTKIQSGLRLPDNIVVKKIPKDLLDKCTFESEVK